MVQMITIYIKVIQKMNMKSVIYLKRMTMNLKIMSIKLVIIVIVINNHPRT